jgi:hypothetical protein
MSESVLCDLVWQDDRDGWRYWECTQHGEIESEKIEEDLDDE